MIVDRRLLPHLDWPLIAAVVALALIGLTTVYSVTFDSQRLQAGSEFWAQVRALPIGCAALVACLLVDYRTLAQRSLLIYGAFVAALVYVAFFGAVHQGARRWIPAVAGFSLQPSEFGRVTLALVFAMIYGETRRSARSIGELALGAAFVAVPFYLILRQPDLGTAATLLPVYVGVVTMAGVRLRWLMIGVVVVGLLSPVIWAYGLHDYQRTRIEMFLDPSKDPRGRAVWRLHLTRGRMLWTRA